MHGELEAWLEAAGGSDEEFVARAWRLVVRRPVDDDARERALAALADGTLSRSGLLRELVASDEFAQVAVLDGAVAAAAAERARPRDVRGPARPRGLGAPATSDERAVEIQWCLARYDGEPRVLDVGYAFAEPAYLAGLTALGAAELVGVDLARSRCRACVRSSPTCASSRSPTARSISRCASRRSSTSAATTTSMPSTRRATTAGDEAALRELHRVLGVRRPLARQRSDRRARRPGLADAARRRTTGSRLFERAGFLVFEDELYLHAADGGWRSATPDEVRGVHYGAGGPGAGAVLLAELHPRTIGERLRVAVRDVRHRDEPRRSTQGS